MKIASKVVWNIETGEVLEKVEYEYCGPVAWACGASGEEKSAFANEKTVANLLDTSFQQISSDNETILGNLRRGLTPIQEAGPSQFGLTPSEEAAERMMTAEQLSAAGTNASNAVRGAIASRGGGTNLLPSGSEAAILGTLAQDTAVKEALAQSEITQRGYDIGRQNWEFATEGLMKAPGELETPITKAGVAASGAAASEMQGGQAITQANEAWMAPVGSIIGGVVGGFTGGAFGGKSTKPKIYGAGDPNATGA